MARSTITPRSEDFSQWYQDVIREAALADQSPVRGCIVFRPDGFALWEGMRKDLDRRFQETGHVNAYFPLLIPKSFLSREAEHVEGFAKECAIVTHHRLIQVERNGRIGVEPDPASKLEEELIIRPTSETIIWHMYGKWIDSHRDLPILINQWANVLRWEMRPRAFLRTAEFLWQEGHTAHATRQEAVDETLTILKVYEDFARETLALPVIPGLKTPGERFPGAVETYTIEAMMQDGKALQSGTSHFLGQNFAKAFDVTFQNTDGQREHVWASSWGVSTRLIGAVIMAHSDDTGLVLPPSIAPHQAVIVPIYRKDHERQAVISKGEELVKTLRDAGVRARLDARDGMKPGAKFFEWERKGVPLRLELGPRDLSSESVLVARRDWTDESDFERKAKVPFDALAQIIPEWLSQIQAGLLHRAQSFRDANIHDARDESSLREIIKSGGFARIGWDGSSESEERIKSEVKASLRCIPLSPDGAGDPQGRTDPWSGKAAVNTVLAARSY